MKLWYMHCTQTTTRKGVCKDVLSAELLCNPCHLSCTDASCLARCAALRAHQCVMVQGHNVCHVLFMIASAVAWCVTCRLLSAGQLDQVPNRPALLITDAGRALSKEIKRSTREKELEQAVLGVLRNTGKGSVLLPVDTAGRMLEVLLVLDRIWQPRASAAR